MPLGVNEAGSAHLGSIGTRRSGKWPTPSGIINMNGPGGLQLPRYTYESPDGRRIRNLLHSMLFRFLVATENNIRQRLDVNTTTLNQLYTWVPCVPWQELRTQKTTSSNKRTPQNFDVRQGKLP